MLSVGAAAIGACSAGRSQHRHARPRDDRGARYGPQHEGSEDVKRATENVAAIDAQLQAFDDTVPKRRSRSPHVTTRR